MSAFVLRVLHAVPDWVFSAYAATAGLILLLALCLVFRKSTRRLAFHILGALGAAFIVGFACYSWDLVPSPPIAATDGLQALATGFGYWLDRVHLACAVSAVILILGLLLTGVRNRVSVT
jgi:hypothetical protein